MNGLPLVSAKRELKGEAVPAAVRRRVVGSRAEEPRWDRA